MQTNIKEAINIIWEKLGNYAEDSLGSKIGSGHYDDPDTDNTYAEEWIIVYAYGEWQVSDGPVGERCCSYDFDTKVEAEEYLKWLKEELR